MSPTEVQNPEQLGLDFVTEVHPFRIRPAVCLLGRTEVQHCREILENASPRFDS